ncbi:MAG: xylose isomerase [Actinomycetales bacterium]|nr:xylose isomerase [Actinomycetales bacterium]
MADRRLDPVPADNFAFGLWTIGNVGRDAFGDPTRPPVAPAEFVRGLGRVGAAGVSFHDDDLIPPGSSAAEAERVLAEFRSALDATGVRVTMATTNLFTHPCFKDGAFTSNDRGVRRHALAKAMRGIDLGASLGAPVYVLWGGREGVECGAAKRPQDALARYAEAVNFLCGYVRDRGYPMRFAIEPKPNEPRGDTFLPTIGHALAFITTLDQPDMVGVNPEVAHETMVGLSFHQGIGQALWQGKLFHIDLNDQKIGRYDQDFRFGSEGIKENFLLVRLLETSGYTGTKHFDSRPYRNEWGDGIWEFARGSMRTYLALAAAAREFDADPAVVAALAAAGAGELAEESVGAYTPTAAAALLAEPADPEQLAARSYVNERLDQLLIDHLLGLPRA